MVDVEGSAMGERSLECLGSSGQLFSPYARNVEFVAFGGASIFWELEIAY